MVIKIDYEPMEELTRSEKRWLYSDWQRMNNVTRKATAIFIALIIFVAAAGLGLFLSRLFTFNPSFQALLLFLYPAALMVALILFNVQIARELLSGYIGTLGCYLSILLMAIFVDSSYGRLFFLSLIPSAFVGISLLNYKLRVLLKNENGFPSFLETQQSIQAAEIYSNPAEIFEFADKEYKGWNAFENEITAEGGTEDNYDEDKKAD